MKNLIKEQWLFLQALRSDPNMVGAAFPSSRSLAKKMVQQIPSQTQGLIVELGAGTGPITHYLQKRFPHDQLAIIERSEDMVNFLKKKFPDIAILLGDAVELPNLIAAFQKPVEIIISSLPMRSIPPEIADKIQRVISECLAKNGLLIQFTYDPRANAKQVFPQLKLLYRKTVWLNIPPANVDVYQK